MNENGKLSIKQACNLLGCTRTSVLRLLKDERLTGSIQEFKFGKKWLIDETSVALLVSEKMNKNRVDVSKKNKNVHPFAHSMNTVSIDVNQLYQDFQGAILRLGQLQSQNDNFKKMLEAGQDEKSHIQEENSQIRKDLRKWKYAFLFSVSLVIFLLVILLFSFLGFTLSPLK